MNEAVKKSVKPTKRRKRGSLVAGDVVAAAIEVIERDGLTQMTMPSLAREMNVPVTSIYWHFRTRDDLLSVVAEQVTKSLYESLPPTDRRRSWEDEIHKYFTNVRVAMLANRAFIALMAERS